MSKKPKVAVITRTKDRPVFLSRAIESVHKQSLTDFVHVIINDGGDKESVNKIVDVYKDITRDRIKLIHNETSKGMEAASNKAISSVESVYIAIHDDDDTWHPDFLQKMTDQADSVGSMGVVARTDKVTERLQSDGSIVHKKTEPWMPDVRVINLYRQCIDNQMTPITFLFKREAYEALGGFDESLPVCGDWDFGIRFLQKYDVEFLDPGFALANYHHRSLSQASEGGSIYAGNDKHRYWSNFLMNKYLRQELNEGRLGVGYIMSKIRYEQSFMARLVKSVLPDFVARRIKKKV